MTEAETFAAYCKLRWSATNGEPICPRCSFGESYSIRTRGGFKCKRCHKHYTPTNGTLWDRRKVSLAKLLALFELPPAITIAGAASALNTNPRAAAVLLLKLRAARVRFPDLSPAAAPSIPEFVGEFQRWRRAAR